MSRRRSSLHLALCASLVLAAHAHAQQAGPSENVDNSATPAATADSAESLPPRSLWESEAELGAGYDSNANGSTSVQSFLGFPLDPRYVATASSFGQAALALQHTLNLSPQSGFISSLQLSHRANPSALFADQSIVALGTEGVLGRGAARFSFALGGYTSWLHGNADERGGNLDLNAAFAAGGIEAIVTLRVSRLEYAQRDYENLELNRYLAAFSLNRTQLGGHDATVGVAIVGGHDTPLRAGSPFQNNRIGAQASLDWRIAERTRASLEVSLLRSDFTERFFDQERTDHQLSAAAALEIANFPGKGWVLTPQLQYLRNDSTVSVFGYDRLQAAIFVRRAL